MPTLASMQIPPPTDWGEFESIVLDAMAIRWTSPNLQKIGRSGQGQQGVDIYGLNNLGQAVGIQCKKRKGKLKEKDVDAEIAKAAHFKPVLSVLYIATTQELDAPLQSMVRLKSAARVATGGFAVQILFWDDIIQNLVTNPQVFATHYPSLASKTMYVKAGLRLFTLLDLVFYGNTLDHHADVIFGECGVMTGVDPDNIFRLSALIRTSAIQVLGSVDQQKVEQELVHYEKVIKEIFALSKTFVLAQNSEENMSPAVEQQFRAEVKKKWAQSEIYAERIARHLDGIRSTLPTPALAVFNLGTSLATWEKFEFNTSTSKPISIQQQGNITTLTSIVAPTALAKVKRFMKKYNTDQYARANTAEVIFEIIHAVLVMDEIKSL